MGASRRRGIARSAGIAATIATIALVAAACSPSKSQPYQAGSVPAGEPTATVSPLAPAAGFLSQSVGGDDQTFDVWDWNGKRLRTLHTLPVLRHDAPFGGVTSETTGWIGPRAAIDPFGKRILVNQPGVYGPDAYTITDLTGRTVMKADGTGGFWATDGRHLCGTAQTDANAGVLDFASPPGPPSLIVTDPGVGVHVVHIGVPFVEDNDGPRVLWCDIASNRAVLADYQDHAYEVNLSTGATTTPRWAPSSNTRVIAVSGNGRDAIVEVSTGTDEIGRVVDTRTGKVVERLDLDPAAISWNGHLVLESTYAKSEVVDWSTGRTVWEIDTSNQGPGSSSGTATAVAARSDSDDLAINIVGVPYKAYPLGTLVLVTTRAKPEMLATSLRPEII